MAEFGVLCPLAPLVLKASGNLFDLGLGQGLSCHHACPTAYPEMWLDLVVEE